MGHAMKPANDSLEVFISASIPDEERWDGHFDPYEITDAVVAFTRAMLTAGATLVTAAHPTIAPLILNVARELPELENEENRVRLYQSDLFRGHIPNATLILIEEPFVTIEWTLKGPGDEPLHGKWDTSLDTMRRTMFNRPLDGAVFIGGMEGIAKEHRMLTATNSDASVYPVRAPGGAAAELPIASNFAPDLARGLADGRLYPHLADLVIEDLQGNRHSAE